MTEIRRTTHDLARTSVIGERRTLTVTARLVQLKGNERPYFSITAEERNLRRRGDNQIECCGCMHEDIVKHWPDLEPLVALHLSDDNGVPMHAAANALYWAGLTKWTDVNIPVLASHLRISEAEASALVERLTSSEDPKVEMDAIVEEMSPRWFAEATSAIAQIEKG